MFPLSRRGNELQLDLQFQSEEVVDYRGKKCDTKDFYRMCKSIIELSGETLYEIAALEMNSRETHFCGCIFRIVKIDV